MKTEIASKFYNAAGVQEENMPFSERSRMIFDRIRPYCERLIFPDAKVLDIGCGNGRTSFEIEKMGADVVGLDCANDVLNFAREFALKTNSKAAFVNDDALNMPFDENIFDFVFLLSNNISEFSYDDMDRLSGEVRRVLKNDGVFCIYMNDMFMHWNGKHHDMTNYAYEHGLLLHNYTIPDKGKFPYHSHIWTVGMAKFILSRYFSQISIEKADDKRFWVECR